MRISTQFINSLIISISLAGCAAQQEVGPDTPSRQEVEKALKQTSESDITRYKAALSLMTNGRLKEAEEKLNDFAQDQPALAGPWANLGLISLKQNKLDEAEQRLQQALKRNPDMAQAHNLLGVIEKQRGNIVKAREYFSKAVELKDDYILAHYNLALIYDIYIQDIYKAIAHYQKYLTLTKYKDKKTAQWLDQLKASLKRS